MNKNIFDIAVIGGGVIGLMTARELHMQGMKVVVLEKNARLAMEASRAGGGIISPLHPWRYSQAMLDLAVWSHERYSSIAYQLSSETDIHVPIIKTGMLVPNTDEAESALKCSFLFSKILTAEQTYQYEPGLAKTTESVWVEGVHNIRNPALCLALEKFVQQSAIQLKTNIQVQSIQKKGTIFELCSNDGSIFAEKVVVCAGAWSSQLMRLFPQIDMCQMPEIFPVKGQMIAYQAKPGVLRSVILEKNRYLIPRHDGVVLVGSSVEYKQFNKDLTQDIFDDLVQFSQSKIPALKQYPIISHWSGLRPGSHRDRPIIGSVDTLKGLYLNIGHFRNGLLSAPASAKVISDIIMQQNSEFNLQGYAL